MNSNNYISLKGVFDLLAVFFIAISLVFSYLYPFHLEPWVTFYNELLFVFFICFGVLWCISLNILKLTFSWTFIGLIFLLFVHIFSAESSWIQMTNGGFFLLYLVVGWLAYSFGLSIRGSSVLDLVLFGVFLSALLSSLIAIVQWAGLPSLLGFGPEFIFPFQGGGRVVSNIGQANNLGTLLILGIGALGYSYWRGFLFSTLIRWIALASFVVIIFGVYLSGSRTAIINLMLWPVLYYIWVRRGIASWSWLILFPISCLGIFYALMPALIDWFGWFPVEPARSLVSDNTRLRLWSMLEGSIWSSPIWGHGFGAVANSHLQFSPQYGSFGNSIAQHAHNSVLDMWLVFGLPLGTLLVVGMAWLWLKAWRACQEPKDQCLWLMTTAMLVHGMLEYPLHYGFFLWLLFLLFGVLAGQPWKTLEFKRPMGAALVWLTVFMAAALPLWSAYVQLERMYTLFRQQGPEVTNQVLANSEFPLSRTLYAEPYQRLRWVTTPMAEVLTLSDEQLLALEKQALRYPLPSLGWRMAFAQAARGNGDQAAWWAERMCVMFDPGVCASAAEEWQRRSAENPSWPELPWGKWLQP